MQGKLKIHSQNILPIIKKWLYSEKEVFVRELVSNACDACFKLKVLKEQGTAIHGSDDLRIDITIKDNTITFSDTGIGMTADEVEKYIAQIAFSGAEEFIAHYQSGSKQEQIIGHFGLGFYSAYMAASHVDIETRSYRPEAEAAFWSCDGSIDYTLEASNRNERGTSITLHIAKEHEDVLDKSHFRGLLEHYCRFLPWPIYLDGEQINKEEPLWNKPSLDCTDKDYQKFFKTLYPFEEEPLFWVHLHVDYPFNLKGILYFPPLKNSPLKENQIQLFCNRVFVSDNVSDLLPHYLTILKGVIDSPDIPLNVSRSALQKDRTVKQLAGHISRKVAEKLALFFEQNKERFIEAWPHLEPIVKLGILQDEKFFEKVEKILIWKNAKGEWLTLDEFLKDKKKIIYATHANHALCDVVHERGEEVLISESPFDIPLFSFLESRRSASVKFQRLDASFEEMIDKTREKTLLDAEGRTYESRLSDFVKRKLNREDLQIEAKSLVSDQLPAFVMINEEERRMRDYMALHRPEMVASMAIKPKKTFVINTNSPLVQSLEKLEAKDPQLSQAILEQLYNLSLLAQKELDANALSDFVKNEAGLLERLTTL